MDTLENLVESIKTRNGGYPPSKNENGDLITPPYTSCFHEDTLIWMADGTEKPIKDIKVGDAVKGYDTYFEPEESPGFDGASVMLNPIMDGVVMGIIEKEVDELMKLNFNNDKTLLIEKEALAYARPLTCGTIEHDDGTVTEGCSSEGKNNGIEGSTSEYEAHACCNVGWMVLDMEAALAKYGEHNPEGNSTGAIRLNEVCGLDYGTGVYSNEEKITTDGMEGLNLKEAEKFMTTEEANPIRRLFALQNDKDYKIMDWEIVKGPFKVYNFTRVEDLQLIYANSFVFGSGEIFNKN